jgi:8-oxo-dGTP diphosphatase
VQDPLDHTKVFAGIRKGSHGSGTLSLPGGHLEMMESWEECARREVEEETGLKVHAFKMVHVTNDPMPLENKHYITIFMAAKCENESDRPVNLEPNKCEGWDSYSWNDLCEIIVSEDDEGSKVRLFGPLKRLVEDSPINVTNFLSE